MDSLFASDLSPMTASFELNKKLKSSATIIRLFLICVKKNLTRFEAFLEFLNVQFQYLYFYITFLVKDKIYFHVKRSCMRVIQTN